MWTSTCHSLVSLLSFCYRSCLNWLSELHMQREQTWPVLLCKHTSQVSCLLLQHLRSPNEEGISEGWLWRAKKQREAACSSVLLKHTPLSKHAVSVPVPQMPQLQWQGTQAPYSQTLSCRVKAFAPVWRKPLPEASGKRDVVSLQMHFSLHCYRSAIQNTLANIPGVKRAKGRQHQQVASLCAHADGTPGSPNQGGLHCKWPMSQWMLASKKLPWHFLIQEESTEHLQDTADTCVAKDKREKPGQPGRRVYALMHLSVWAFWGSQASRLSSFVPRLPYLSSIS